MDDAPVVVNQSLADPTLALAADVLDDLETVRIANENRLARLKSLMLEIFRCDPLHLRTDSAPVQ